MDGLTVKHPFLDGCKNVPKGKEEDVKLLTSWLQTKSQLPRLTEDHLYLFLHANYYDVEAAKSNIEAYYKIRSGAPEIFAKRCAQDPGLNAAWAMSVQVCLPKTTSEGYKVFVIKITDFDSRKFVHLNCARAMFTCFDVQVAQDDDLCPGYIVVFDTIGFSFYHFVKFNWAVMQKTTKYIQDGIPIRLQAIHIINSVSFVDKILAFMRPFLNSAFLNKIHIHGSDLSNFMRQVPLDILPQDYGGKEVPLSVLHQGYRQLVASRYDKWLQEEDLFVVDPSKQPQTTNSRFSFFS